MGCRWGRPRRERAGSQLPPDILEAIIYAVYFCPRSEKRGVDHVGIGAEASSLVEVELSCELSGGEVPWSVVGGDAACDEDLGDLGAGTVVRPTVMYPRSTASRAEKGPNPREKVNAIDCPTISEASSMVISLVAASSASGLPCMPHAPPRRQEPRQWPRSSTWCLRST